MSWTLPFPLGSFPEEEAQPSPSSVSLTPFYTQAYVLARTAELLPQPVQVDRTGTTDVADLLDDVKSRIASALLNDPDAIYYLASLTARELLDTLTQLQTAAAAMVKYGVASKTPSSPISSVPVKLDTGAVLAAQSPTDVAATAAKLSKALVAAAQTSSGTLGITIDTAQAVGTFTAACEQYNKYWPVAQQLIGALRSLRSSVSYLDELSAAATRRQARVVANMLNTHASNGSVIGTQAAVDMLIAAKLLATSGKPYQLTPIKFSGGYPAEVFKRDSDALYITDASMLSLPLRHGDLIYADDLAAGSLIDVTGTTIRAAAGAILGSGTTYKIVSMGASNFVLAERLLDAINSYVPALTANVVASANQYVSGAAQAPAVLSVLPRAVDAVVYLQGISVFQANRVAAVDQLLATLREERVAPAVRMLLELDFKSLAALSASDFSEHDTTLTLLDTAASALEPSTFVYDTTEVRSTTNDYNSRPRSGG